MSIRIGLDQEFELLKSSLAFEEAADRLPDVVALFDQNLRHVFVNKVIEEITGIPRHQYLNKSNRELGMPEALCDLWDAHMAKSFETGEPFSMEFEFNGPKGPQIFLAMGAPHRDQNGKFTRLVVITRDITKIKHQQDALVRSAQSSSINHLCRELAHHLNNPLSVIIGQLFMLKKATSRMSDPTVATLTAKMEKTLNRIEDIVRNLNRITHRTSVYDSSNTTFSLQDAVSVALSLCSERYPGFDFFPDVSIPSDCYLTGNQPDLIEAVYEVVSNAYDAAASTSVPWIRITAAVENDHVLLRVVDSGPRENIKDAKEIFLPFFTTKGPSVKGLGLSIASENLRRFGGTLSYDQSAANTTFVFALPLTRKVE